MKKLRVIYFSFNNFMRFVYVLTVFTLVTGCSGSDEFVPVYEVPEEYQKYIDSFIAEAASRGHTVDIRNLIVETDPVLQGAVCGVCNSNSLNEDIQKIITVNGALPCWFSEEDKEAFFFHEMGHCILGRVHDNTSLPNGDPKSIMVEGNLAIYAPCLYPIDDKPCNNFFKRDYYLDELFDKNTPVPDWAK